MTRNPFGPDELDRTDPSLDRVADRLEQYAAQHDAAPPLDLAGRINSAIDELPDRPGSAWAWFTTGLHALRTPARGLAIAAVMVAAVVGAIALGELTQNVRRDDLGTSPSQVPLVSPTPTPSPTETPTPSPSATPTGSPSPSPTLRAPITPVPTASDDHGGDDPETPKPSGSDNSGPGGGGSGSGSGSGSDDG